MIETANSAPLFEIIQRGGWVMYPLLLCSLVAAAIIIERFIWGPRRSREIPPALAGEIERLLDQGKLDELTGICRADNSSLSRLILTAIRHANRPRPEIVGALRVVGRKEIQRLQRYLLPLGTIAAITPLMGLLGTVFGMINVFAVIRVQGVGNATALAGGISEALTTTATGLTIAIPCLVFHRYFTQQSRRLVMEMEGFCLEALERLLSKPTETAERKQLG